MKKLDENDATHVKICVYGPSGTGKTSLGVTAPKPLILLSEQQGALHIKQAALRLKVDMPATLIMEEPGDYKAVIRALHGDKKQPFKVLLKDGTVAHEGEWPETVVVDSLTDMGRLIVADIRKQSPPKAGKDGLPVDAQRFWGVLGDRMQNAVLAFRDVPVNTLFLCLSDDRMVGPDDSQVREVRPDLPMRKLGNFLASTCNLMGFSYRAEDRKGGKSKVDYGVLFRGPETHLLKPCAPLRPTEKPDASMWLKAIEGGLKKMPARPVATQDHQENDNDKKDNGEK